MSGLKGITVNTAPEAEAHILAEDDAAIYQSIVGVDGVFNVGQKLKATIESNNLVTIADGVLFVGGHFARVQFGDKIECQIANGQTGQNRNDLIVAKFETSNGIDIMSISVIEGVSGAVATDPEVSKEELYSGGKLREVPLYRVKIEGLSIVEVEPLFEIIPCLNDLCTQRSHVGMIIQSTTLDTMEKVIEVYGGISWELIEEKVLMGASDKYKVGTTGGKTKYTLSAAIGAVGSDTATLGYVSGGPSEYQRAHTPPLVVYGDRAGTNVNVGWNHSTPVTEAGVNDRNVTIEPPYFATYMWHRVA